MINYEELADLFKMFGDGTRVRIMDLLTSGEMSVGEMAKSLDMSDSAVSHQLSMLKSRKLVKALRRGKNVYYSLDDEHVCEIIISGKEHISEADR